MRRTRMLTRAQACAYFQIIFDEVKISGISFPSLMIENNTLAFILLFYNSSGFWLEIVILISLKLLLTAQRDKTVPAICHFICGNPKESGYFSQNIELKIEIIGALLTLD